MPRTPLAEPDLSHIDGPPGRPFVGNTLDFVWNAYDFNRRSAERYGEVFLTSMLGRRRVVLHGADALEHVLADQERNFSSEQGWDVLTLLFPGGLMLRDFDDHRRHRRVMQSAFKAPAMRAYLARMGVEIDRLLEAWPDDRRFDFFAAVKDLTLRMGGVVFMGLPSDDPEAERMNRAFADEVAASLGLVRRPLPFTKLGRGVRGRRMLARRFRGLIEERRVGGGEDFFSQICRATDDDGVGWTDEEIVDHFNFLMMAAHDTTSTTLTAMAWALTSHPDWQERVRAEVAALGGALDGEALARMPLTERVMKEALRLVPPVPFVPRRVMRDFEWRGVPIPAGTMITVTPGLVMRSERHWTDPETFDPDRFSPNRAEDRSHRFAWAPFGGGAHKCIGMHFAIMQIKVFYALLLGSRRLERAEGGPVRWRRVPIPKPVGGLPVRLRRL
jgi:cytochrome P450